MSKTLIGLAIASAVLLGFNPIPLSKNAPEGTFFSEGGIYRIEGGKWLVSQSGGLQSGLELWLALESDKYGVDYRLLSCIAEKESGFNPFAVGDHGKAKGMFQIHTDKHPIGEECAFNVACAAGFTSQKIKEGKGYLWTTYKGCVAYEKTL